MVDHATRRLGVLLSPEHPTHLLQGTLKLLLQQRMGRTLKLLLSLQTLGFELHFSFPTPCLHFPKVMLEANDTTLQVLVVGCNQHLGRVPMKDRVGLGSVHCAVGEDKAYGYCRVG